MLHESAAVRKEVPSAIEESPSAKPTAAEHPVEESAGRKSSPDPKLEEPTAASKAVQSYCVNIANAAGDARHLFQKKQLDKMKGEIEQKTAELEKKIAEYKDWMVRRDTFASKAQESLVSIYASMAPESAARQITELDEETASAIMTKLDPKQSRAILSEMDAKKAARMMETIAAAGRLPQLARSPEKTLSGVSEEDATAPPQGGEATSR